MIKTFFAHDNVKQTFCCVSKLAVNVMNEMVINNISTSFARWQHLSCIIQ